MHEKVAKANQWHGRSSSMVKYRAIKYKLLRKLWKSGTVPCIRFGRNVINWNERDMQKFDALSKLGRSTLCATVEALIGYMGWRIFSDLYEK